MTKQMPVTKESFRTELERLVRNFAANEDGLIDNPWGPPHCSHRFGIDADLRIRNVPAEFRRSFQDAIEENELRTPFRVESPQNPQATHWHLRG